MEENTTTTTTSSTEESFFSPQEEETTSSTLEGENRQLIIDNEEDEEEEEEEVLDWDDLPSVDSDSEKTKYEEGDLVMVKTKQENRIQIGKITMNNSKYKYFRW